MRVFSFLFLIGLLGLPASFARSHDRSSISTDTCPSHSGLYRPDWNGSDTASLIALAEKNTESDGSEKDCDSGRTFHFNVDLANQTFFVFPGNEPKVVPDKRNAPPRAPPAQSLS